MPLIYLPLIMYAGWMEFMLQPLRNAVAAEEAPELRAHTTGEGVKACRSVIPA